MSDKKREKVSLILTTYNCQDNLRKTLDSIEKQDYPNLEIIIKDGGSTDKTLDIIREYQQNSHLEIISKSEKDKGIFDAMNQGYALCTGEIVAFFNDVFLDNSAITKLVNAMNTPDGGYVGAHADLVYREGERVIRKWHMGEGNIYQGWLPGHPTLYLRREIYEKYGLYDAAFRIGADYEFMIRFLKDKTNKIAYVPETLVSMFYGGTSSNGLSSYLKSLAEGHRALKKNKIPAAWLVDIKRTIRVLLQFR